MWACAHWCASPKLVITQQFPVTNIRRQDGKNKRGGRCMRLIERVFPGGDARSGSSSIGAEKSTLRVGSEPLFFRPLIRIVRVEEELFAADYFAAAGRYALTKSRSSSLRFGPHASNPESRGFLLLQRSGW